jgi:hypothetical protein
MSMRTSLPRLPGPHVHPGVPCGERRKGFRPKNPSERHAAWLSIDPGASDQLSEKGLHAKGGWSPFSDRAVGDGVRQLALQKIAFENGKSEHQTVDCGQTN